MYIEPNIRVLKNAIIAGSLVLIIAFVGIMIFGEVQKEVPKAPDPIGITGILTKQDGVYLIDNKTVVKHNEPLDGFIGQSLAIVGTLDEAGILNISQLMVAPEKKIEIEKEIDVGKRVTHTNKLQFSFIIPHDWEVDDRSSEDTIELIISDSSSNITLKYADEIKDADIPEYTEIDQKEIIFNEAKYVSKRIIFENNTFSSDMILPHEECLISESCEGFLIINETSNPISLHAFEQIAESIAFLPEPIGWKVLRINLPNSEWNLYGYYPEEVRLENEIEVMSLIRDDETVVEIEVRPNVTDEKEILNEELSYTNIALPTRDERIYQEDGDEEKIMLLISPDNTSEVKITGFGATFDAFIRTIVFEEK